MSPFDPQGKRPIDRRRRDRWAREHEHRVARRQAACVRGGASAVRARARHARFEGRVDVRWRYDGPMTAHPKIDPEIGEMLFFGYNATGPFSTGMTYQVVDATGNLVRQERFDAPYSSMVHDFITTKEHVIFPIFPLTGSLMRAMQGQPPFAWEPELGTRIGVMRRDGSVADIRWFETDAVLRVPSDERVHGRQSHRRSRDAVRRGATLSRADGTPAIRRRHGRDSPSGSSISATTAEALRAATSTM